VRGTVSDRREAVEARQAVLKAELARIRSLLAGRPEVVALWAFGSVASDRVDEWSDLDLVVVVRSEEGFLDRSVRLGRWLEPRVGADLLVYTPEEVRGLLERPFFREEILRKGVTVPLHPSEDASRWLAFGQEDLRMAELALEEGLFNQVCFHAQQAVEKALKALLAASGELVPRTHRLADLWQRLPATDRNGLAHLRHAAFDLDRYYLPARYPDALPGVLPEGLPGKEHAERAVETCRRVLGYVRQQLGGAQ
jgi:HEPN domain-containing protein/predicted nucleotidyltransferase